MTLQDLWLVIKHYSKWVILVPAICAVLVGGAGALLGVVNGAVYTASSTLTVIDPTGLVSSTSLANLVNVFARDQAELENNGDNGVTVKAEVDSSTQSIKFEVAAPSEQESMDIANRLAERTADAAQSALVEQGTAYMEAVDEMGNQPFAEESTYINAGGNSRKGCCFALMFLFGVFGNQRPKQTEWYRALSSICWLVFSAACSWLSAPLL